MQPSDQVLEWEEQDRGQVGSTGQKVWSDDCLVI